MDNKQGSNSIYFTIRIKKYYNIRQLNLNLSSHTEILNLQIFKSGCTRLGEENFCICHIWSFCGQLCPVYGLSF